MRFPFEAENNGINRRKFFILCFGVGLFFFTSMSKMLVPGPIYNHLLNELSLKALTELLEDPAFDEKIDQALDQLTISSSVSPESPESIPTP